MITFEYVLMIGVFAGVIANVWVAYQVRDRLDAVVKELQKK
jgi:hypothetical protein